mgnify:CR=1 FL=1
MRVKRAVHARKRKKSLFKAAKGYRGGRSRLLRTVKDAVDRSREYSYRDRKVKKRDFRRRLSHRPDGLYWARISAFDFRFSENIRKNFDFAPTEPSRFSTFWTLFGELFWIFSFTKPGHRGRLTIEIRAFIRKANHKKCQNTYSSFTRLS